MIRKLIFLLYHDTYLTEPLNTLRWVDPFVLQIVSRFYVLVHVSILLKKSPAIVKLNDPCRRHALRGDGESTICGNTKKHLLNKIYVTGKVMYTKCLN